jgi:hypothetical protein
MLPHNYCALCFSLNIPTESFFKRFNPGFPLFEQQFNPEFVADHDVVPEALLKGNDSDYLHFEDLPIPAKTEALVVILVSACLNLSSSAYKHLIQDIFGRLCFHARSGICPFVVNRKGDPSQLTSDAAAYLHGRCLSDLMGAAEEAFIRFVMVTDFLRYHFDVIIALSKKYRHLIGSDNYKKIAALTNCYEGKIAKKPEKGFRDSDIIFFQEMKSTVITERRSMTIVPSDGEHAHGASEALQNQFVFHYPGAFMKVKEEESVKRKETQDPLTYSNSKVQELMAMPLDDDDDDCFDYRAALLIKASHV